MVLVMDHEYLERHEVLRSIAQALTDLDEDYCLVRNNQGVVHHENGLQ